MDEKDKLRVLIPHWIEHNQEHAQEFEQWAQTAPEVSNDIQEAVKAMEQVNQSLEIALKKLGGPLSRDQYHQHEHQEIE